MAILAARAGTLLPPYHPWYDRGVYHSSPLVPTWGLQLALVLCFLVAGVCGRLAERHGDTWAGIVAVLSMIVGALLFAVLLYRGTR